MPAAPYVDSSPIYFFENNSASESEKAISAKVVLPNSVDISVRTACSKSRWTTEKMARKDVAFEAYIGLYHAGLINQNLLPVGHADEIIAGAYAAIEKRPSIVDVAVQIDAWPTVAQDWQQAGQIYGSLVKLGDQDATHAEMLMLLPQELPQISEFDVYWDANITFKAVIKSNLMSFSPKIMASAAVMTSLLLRWVFSSPLFPIFKSPGIPKHGLGVPVTLDICLSSQNQFQKINTDLEKLQ